MTGSENWSKSELLDDKSVRVYIYICLPYDDFSVKFSKPVEWVKMWKIPQSESKVYIDKIVTLITCIVEKI